YLYYSSRINKSHNLNNFYPSKNTTNKYINIHIIYLPITRTLDLLLEQSQSHLILLLGISQLPLQPRIELLLDLPQPNFFLKLLLLFYHLPLHLRLPLLHVLLQFDLFQLKVRDLISHFTEKKVEELVKYI